MREVGAKSWAVSAMCALLGGCGGASDGRVPIRSIAVFGDSFNDVGTFQAATGNPSNPGKFTVNPGTVWVEDIAASYGLTLKPNRALTLDKDASGGATPAVGTATVIGGNGYAEGGARVSQRHSQSGVGNNELIAPIREQISQYLATHHAFPADGLVIIDGGTNDTYAQFSALCLGTDDNGIGAGKTTLAFATAAVEQAANEQVALIKQIKASGAGLVLVASADDWSGNPFAREYLSSAYQSTGCTVPVPPAQITAWTTRFNQILAEGVAGLSGVLYLDTTATWGDALANPARHGFVNVTDPACTNKTPTRSGAFCTTETLVSPDAARTYFWSDNFHPTPHGYQVLSDQARVLLTPVAKRPE